MLSREILWKKGKAKSTIWKGKEMASKVVQQGLEVTTIQRTKVINKELDQIYLV